MGIAVIWHLGRCGRQRFERRNIGQLEANLFPACLVAACLLLIGLTPPAASAFDGLLAARGNHQEGRAGTYAYTSDQLFLNSSIEERLRLAKGLGLRLAYLATWEQRSNDVRGSGSEFDQWLGRPQASLNYSTSNWRFGWSWYAMRSEQRTDGLRLYRDDRFDNSLYAGFELGRGNVEGRWQGGAIDRLEIDGKRRNRDELWSLTSQYRLTESDQIQYGYARSSSDAETFGTENIYERHNLQLQGSRRFADRRGQVGWSARTSWFRQRTVRDVAGGLEYIEPFWSGYRLDDTPEFRDPLESEPASIAVLADNNRDASTGINIGDSATVVREFGGDFCNLILDFGDVVEMSFGRLYIDTRPAVPELFLWQVYLNDDPDGREWGAPLADDEVSVVYREWADGRQGWEIRFDVPVSGRRIKLVDTKLGVTEPEIYVTEFEIYREESATQDESAITSRRHRLSGSLGYEFSPDVQVDYGLSIDLRRFETGERNTTGIGQNLGIDWLRGGWIISGGYQDSRRYREGRTDTEVNSQTLSLMQRQRNDFTMRYALGRSQDLSHGRDLETYNATADGTWQAAPRLTASQRVTYGYRADRENDITAHSWALISRIRSSPRSGLRVDVTRRDRWVSREAGYGFMNFNDTEGLIAWSLTRNITASSRIRYQVREEGEWVLRHFFSWSPLPGGNLQMRFHVNGYRDTRNDSSQIGQGVALTWQPRPRLFLEGGYNVSEYHQAELESSPQNLNFRGTWSF